MLKVLTYFLALKLLHLGKILIDGVGKEVDELTEEEMETYTDIDFDMAAYQADVGTNQLTEDTKVSINQE